MIPLAGALQVPIAAARVLLTRGYDSVESARRFYDPLLNGMADPFLLPDMRKAVDRLWAAIDRRERIVVYGDYDVDGITSTAMMIGVLEALGADVAPFLPHRVDEGYGLGLDALARCVETLRPALILTVDCGTGSVAAVNEAHRLGIDVVVTDHHTPGAYVAAAHALVNPKLGSDPDALALAGVGVAFKLCHALVKSGRGLGREPASRIDLKDYLELVALGTVADIVPLTGENRSMVRFGLSQLTRTRRAGLMALKAVAEIDGEVDTYDVGFRLGPRLNAAGRLGDALAALDLLVTPDVARASELAGRLDQENRNRQEIEAGIVDEAITEVDASFDSAKDFGLVVGRAGWHPGVIGIVASRIVQRYHRPVVALAIEDGVARGSCRSIEDFDLIRGLTRCGNLLTKYGGHAMAAGLELPVDRVGEFRACFNEACRAALQGHDLRPIQRIDAWTDLAGVDLALLEALERMRPFGFGNTTPTLACRGVRLAGEPKRVGSDGQHLRMSLTQGGALRAAVAFGMGDRPVPQGALDVAFQVRRNVFRGEVRVDIQIQDIRLSEAL